MKKLSILSNPGLHTMPENFNGTSVERGYGTVMSLFEEKALSYGENIGLINERKNLNYQEVNEQSNRLAHYLIGKLSVSRGELVGVILERDMHLIPALYGILKSGAAYVPIDPTYPVERIATMLNEAGVNKVVSLTRLFGGLTGKEVIYLDREQEAIEGYSSENPEVSVSPDDTAYVLFTSGSTGKPKGVEVSHSSL
ncbi:MAG: AMP-binding protein, partial [Cyclobacteriaceae bacterium]